MHLALGLLLFNVNQWLALSVILYTVFRFKVLSSNGTSIGAPMFLLCISMLFFFLISVSNESMDLPSCMCMCFTSCLLFISGWKLSSRINDERTNLYFFSIISCALALPHIVVTFQDILHSGLINEGRRLAILDEDLQMDTTLRVIFLSLSMIGTSFLFWNSEGNREYTRFKYIIAIVSVMALFCCLHYLSRTGLFLFAMPLALSFLWSRRKISFSTIAIIVIIVAGIQVFGNSELFTLYQAREKDYSSVSNFGGRDERWLTAIAFILNNPFGSSLSNTIYAHNMWLDFGKDGGIISFILLVLFSLYCYFTLFSSVMHRRLKGVVAFMCVVYTIQMFSSNFTECIHEGARGFLYVYFLLTGYITGYCKKSNL